MFWRSLKGGQEEGKSEGGGLGKDSVEGEERGEEGVRKRTTRA